MSNEQAGFALQHGKRTTDRMVEEILLAISEQLINGKEIFACGKTMHLKPLNGTGVKEQDGVFRLLFDVKNPPDGFDHIEFKIVKTGWGRSLVTTPRDDGR